MKWLYLICNCNTAWLSILLNAKTLVQFLLQTGKTHAHIHERTHTHTNECIYIYIHSYQDASDNPPNNHQKFQKLHIKQVHFYQMQYVISLLVILSIFLFSNKVKCLSSNWKTFVVWLSGTSSEKEVGNICMLHVVCALLFYLVCSAINHVNIS